MLKHLPRISPDLTIEKIEIHFPLTPGAAPVIRVTTRVRTRDARMRSTTKAEITTMHFGEKAVAFIDDLKDRLSQPDDAKTKESE